MRLACALAVFGAVMLAGCVAVPAEGPGPGASNTTARPPANATAAPTVPFEPRPVVVGSLAVASPWRLTFPPQVALVLPPWVFDANASAPRLDVLQPVALAGDGVLRVEGVAEVGWVALLGRLTDDHGQLATLRAERDGEHAWFHVGLSGRALRFDMMPETGRSVPCTGAVTYPGRPPQRVGEDGFWGASAWPGQGEVLVRLDGPGACEGFEARLAHRGWVEARKP